MSADSNTTGGGRQGGRSQRPGRMGRGVAPGAKSRDFSGSFKRLLGEFRPELPRLVLSLFLTAIVVVLNVAAPKVLGHGTDLIFEGVIGTMIAQAPSKEAAVAALQQQGNDKLATMLSSMNVTPGQGIDFDQLGRVLLQVVAMYVGAAILQFVAALLMRYIIQNTGWRMRDQIQDKIEKLPLSYLDRHSRGDLMSRVSNDVDNVTQVMNQTLSQFFQSVLTVIGILAMMLTLSWQLTLLAMVVIPLGAWVAATLMKRAQPQFRSQWRATGDVSGLVEEAMTGHGVVSLYGLEDRFTEEFTRSNTELYDSSFKAQALSNMTQPVMSFISNLSYVIVAVGGGLRVANGQMTLGDVQAFIQYSRNFTQPLVQLATMANSLQSGVASAERIFEFLDAPEVEPDHGAQTFTEAWQQAHPGQDFATQADAGRIVFDHVRFGYVPDTPIIKDLSLSVEPGQMVAIIGPTGAGKTTLVNLLMRFYELDSGSITIDGVDIRDLTRDALRRHLGMVLQDTWLFDGTIYDNIAFGREGATRDEVIEAATATGVARLVHQLPEGYDTEVSDDGESVSAGERQLLTIARAFISQPDLLILDEATSSVDTLTEVLVQRAMDHLRRGRTAFVIAHRLSTIRDADLILVMEDGDVVEKGRHNELLAAGGAYAHLYQAQFSGPATGDGDISA